MLPKEIKKVTLLGIVKYLVSKGQVSRSAYLEYVYFKDNRLYLHWYDNEPKDIEIPEYYCEFYVEIEGHIKYFVHRSHEIYKCKVYDTDNKDYQNYRCYRKYCYNIIAECGYWDNDNHYITKEFHKNTMTEYSYEGKNGKKVKTPGKIVYEGEYEYNPKQHFPRKNKKIAGQGSQVDNDIQNNANTENQKNSKLSAYVIICRF